MGAVDYYRNSTSTISGYFILEGKEAILSLNSKTWMLRASSHSVKLIASNALIKVRILDWNSIKKSIMMFKITYIRLWATTSSDNVFSYLRFVCQTFQIVDFCKSRMAVLYVCWIRVLNWHLKEYLKENEATAFITTLTKHNFALCSTISRYHDLRSFEMRAKSTV